MSGTDKIEPGAPVEPERNTPKYSRREAMRAVMKYSATVGGATAVVLTADGVVSVAHASHQSGCGPSGGRPKKCDHG